MATANANLPSFFNTDAEFQTFCQFFHNLLNAGGWVNTSDTGQINVNTVTKPGAASTSQGYEIWHMADTQETNLPCFMKIEYGSAATAADRPAVWVTIGTGSNGSGTLTGQLTTRSTVGAQASKSAGGTLPAYASASSDRFCFVLNYDSASNTFHFMGCVERSADSNGSATADCVYTFLHHSGVQKVQIMPPSPTAVPSQGTTGPFNAYPSTANGDLSSIGNNVAVMPPVFMCGKPFFVRSFLGYKDADITGGSTIVGQGPGGQHTYVAFTKTSGLNPGDQSGSTTSSLMLYE